jgi:DNA-binding MarR family transcriptional regulator
MGCIIHPMNNQQLAAAEPEKLELGMLALLGAARNIQERVERALEGVGLSSAKFQALDQLAKAGGPLALSELAGCLKCVRSNVTQLVDRLEADGLVKRTAHPDDRRAIQALLTPLGAERHSAGAAAVRDVQLDLASRLDPKDGEVLLKALTALC